MKKVIAIVLTVLLCMLLPACDTTPIVRAEDTEYVILQITDIHLSNNAVYPKRAFRTIDDLVEISKPDYIVFTGDVTNEEDNFRAVKTFCEYMEGLNIPWAYTLGNHDTEGTTGKAELAEYLEGLENCIFTRGPADVFGEGNSYLTLRADEKALMTLFFLDCTGETGGTHEYTQDQIEWYENSVRQIALAENGNETQYVPSIAFTHIPTREFQGAYDAAVEAGEVLYGSRNEKECPAEQDDLMLETMIRCGTKGLFVGHEHINNYVVNYNGIRLSYAETLCHRMYIPTRGGTLINIKSDGTFTQQGIVRKRDSARYTISPEF